MHVHVVSPDGEAKFWIEPLVALDCYQGFSLKQLNELEKIVRNNESQIKKAWKKHFGS